MPRISVVMSVYKEPIKWLKESIDSILNQTYRDFEFIIINDNPDRVENHLVLAEYAKHDARMIILSNEINLGLTKSLNKGLAIAKGDYIARMDADDIAYNDRLEKQMSFFKKWPDYKICHTAYNIIDKDGKQKSNFVLSEIQASSSFLLVEDMIAHPTVMFRRELISLRTPLYNESYKSAQDYELWSFLFLKGIMFGYIPDICLSYRKSPNQISNRSKSSQQNNGRLIRKKMILTYLANLGVAVDNGSSVKKILKAIDETSDSKWTNATDKHLLKYLMYYNLTIENYTNIIKFVSDSDKIKAILPFSITKHIYLAPLFRRRWSTLLF